MTTFNYQYSTTSGFVPINASLSSMMGGLGMTLVSTVDFVRIRHIRLIDRCHPPSQYLVGPEQPTTCCG